MWLYFMSDELLIFFLNKHLEVWIPLRTNVTYKPGRKLRVASPPHTLLSVLHSTAPAGLCPWRGRSRARRWWWRRCAALPAAARSASPRFHRPSVRARPCGERNHAAASSGHTSLFSIAIYTVAFTISSNVLLTPTPLLPTLNKGAKDLRVGRRENRGREPL